MSDLIQFINCKILRDHKIIKEDLWVRNGKIINPERIFFDEKIQASRKIDCNGLIIAPGFIELQINGGFGHDFSFNTENLEKGLNLVSKNLLSHGVTAYCPTLVTSPREIYHKIVPKIRKSQGGVHGATILGVHTEGPFINVEKKGAHPPNCIKGFDKGLQSVEDMYGNLDNIKIITLAPELTNADEVIRKLSQKGIVVSVGHSMANLSEGEKAINCGASLITHLFNAMLPFHHRDPGLVGLLTSKKIPPGKTVYFGIIADGVHTHPAALRIAHRVHPEGLVLVTDAIAALGLAEGNYNLGQFEIEVRNGRAYIAKTDTLCGSIASMIECVRSFLTSTGCSVEYALEAASLHPAKALGIESVKGTLNFGADADFIMLDEKLELKSTWIAGEKVYSK
ncbi:N-acetylglucosamine-6-phosphate deacetylase [Tribolium madens]|uniref:N-acetylglucosamine-6-phosphate deacetylase n=1 Tax=Tribolium madens TaxID=41895 RepID=UPI001CF72C06|nr:N-acetylglucosamine-6-phosphate deacetylase [Tribolium madens]